MNCPFDLHSPTRLEDHEMPLTPLFPPHLLEFDLLVPLLALLAYDGRALPPHDAHAVLDLLHVGGQLLLHVPQAQRLHALLVGDPLAHALHNPEVGRGGGGRRKEFRLCSPGSGGVRLMAV